MSNYLNHLVTRSLKPLETSVQPRLPSLFEPLAGVPALGPVAVDSSTPEGISEFEATPRRQVTSPLRPTDHEDVPSVDGRQLSSSQIEHPSVQARPIANLDDLRFKPSVRASLELPDAPLSPIPHPQQDRVQPVNQVPTPVKAIDSTEQNPTIIQQTIIQKVVDQLFSSQPSGVDSSQAPVTPTVRQEDRPAAIAPSLPNATQLPPPAPMPVRHSPAEGVKPQISPLIQPIQTTVIAPTEPSQPAPTIQVTIGRIEVRATRALKVEPTLIG